jgi:outer membrane protein OmpA-like peptidoglycan-associated protein
MMFKRSKTSEMQQLRAAGFTLANADRLARNKRGSGAMLAGASVVALVLMGGIITLGFDLTRSVERASQQARVATSGTTSASAQPPAVAEVGGDPLRSETLRNLQQTQLTRSFAPEITEEDLDASPEQITRTEGGISARLEALTTAATTPVALTTDTRVPVQGDCVAELGERLRSFSMPFDMASTALPDAAPATLRDIAARLQNCSTAKVMINGHSDSTGPEMTNVQISWERADRTMSQLVEFGAPAAQLEAFGFGTRVPVTPQTPATAPENRRVDFRVMRREETQG